MKKILSLLLCVLMVLSLLPFQVFAADEGQASVYVTVSQEGTIPLGKDEKQTLMAEVPIPISAGATLHDVLLRLHQDYCPDGYFYGNTGGYESVKKLWGKETGNTLFAVNGNGVLSGPTTTTVQDKDHITVSVNQDNTYYADWISSFDAMSKTTQVNQPVTLTLKGHLGMAYYPDDMVEVPLGEISVGTVSASGLTVLETTDSNGQVSLSFDQAGTYYISARGTVLDEVVTNWNTMEKEKKPCPIIAPICVLTVKEDGGDPGPGGQEEPLGPRGSYFSLGASLNEIPTTGSAGRSFYQAKDGSVSTSAYFNPDCKQYSATVSQVTSAVTLSYAMLQNLMPKESARASTNCNILVKGSSTPILSTSMDPDGNPWVSLDAFAKALSQEKIQLVGDKTTLQFEYVRISNPQETYLLDFTITKNSAVEAPKTDIVDQVVDYHPGQGGVSNTDLSAFQFIYEGKTAWYRFASLGGFGGYMTFSFDEPIMNDPKNPYGIDFILYGNNFGYAPEPGNVMVSQDGTTWYTLAGSMQYELTTKQGVPATLLGKETIEAIQIAGTTKDGLLSVGKLEPVYGYGDVHSCSQKLYAEEDDYVTGIPGEIYSADHVNAIGDGFDLMWAVDQDGKPVKIDGIKFIRLQTAVDYSSGFGPMSTEVGTIARTKAESAEVGVTPGLQSLTVNGKEILGSPATVPTAQENNRYYEVNLNDSSISMLDLSAVGKAGDHIVVNNAVFTGSASTRMMLSADGTRMARVVVQSGKMEPVIYTIRAHGGGDPAKNALLSDVTVTPGDIKKNPSTKDEVNFELAQNVSSVKLKLQSFHPEADIQISGGTLSAPISVKSGVQSSAIPIATGKNLFAITVQSTDKSVNHTYTLTLTRADSKPVENIIQVSFKLMGDVDHSNSGKHQEQVWIDTTTLQVPTGSTVKYLTDLMLYNRGIDFSAPDNYITKIKNPSSGAWLEEFTNGPNSGWMYRHNGKIANSGYEQRVLKNGDTVIWSYSDDYTKEKDYESYEPWNGGPTELKPNSDVQTVKPSVQVERGIARASVNESQMREAVSAMQKSGANRLVIAVETGEVLKTADVSLPGSTLSLLASEKGFSLTVETPQGSVQMPQEVLSSLETQSGRGEFRLTIEKKVASEVALDGVNLQGSAILDVKFWADQTPLTQFNGNAITLLIPLPNDKSFEAGKRYKSILLSEHQKPEYTWSETVAQGGTLFAKLNTKHLSTFIVTKEPFTQFTDVGETAWYQDAVAFVLGRGWMDGVSSGTFAPDQSMTRAMLVTVLYRMEGKPAVTGSNPYTDVSADDWYSDAVLWATNHTIVSGYGNGRFGSDNPITREELATILRNYAKLKQYSLKNPKDLAGYQDAGQISSWAQDALGWANAEGLLAGRSEKILAPKDTATRAEVATLLMRFSNTIVP